MMHYCSICGCNTLNNKETYDIISIEELNDQKLLRFTIQVQCIICNYIKTRIILGR